ncbi:hypothetical protein [Pararhodobacter sp.]|uniref:hypothetical protein n=1 Tax=Pararhodobacter sp. TaxID=2127056 RepID=UPI002AFFBCDC|nr:hypothetical protein [Pararhodobacter sp.]
MSATLLGESLTIRKKHGEEKVAAKAMAEYNSTGKLTNFFSSVLDHFKELPAIEQAQYPQDYASDLGQRSAETSTTVRTRPREKVKTPRA